MELNKLRKNYIKRISAKNVIVICKHSNSELNYKHGKKLSIGTKIN